MKLDKKSIIILVLLGVSVIFFGLWYFKGSDTKNKIKELESENRQIEVTMDSLYNVNKSLKLDFDKFQIVINDGEKSIKQIEQNLSKVKLDLINANIKVKDGQKSLSEIKKKIEDLKRNPINRTDSLLINSLKEKLK